MLTLRFWLEEHKGVKTDLGPRGQVMGQEEDEDCCGCKCFKSIGRWEKYESKYESQCKYRRPKSWRKF